MTSKLTLSSRIRGSLIGLAVCDALGGPVEFKARGSFPRVTELLPNNNFGLPAGCFTDDTSMALCLAQSLIENNGKHSTLDQVTKYISWWQTGYMSSVGACFDIGVSTLAVMARWSAHLEQRGYQNVQPESAVGKEIAQSGQAIITSCFSEDKYCGNGSLMRVIPVVLISKSAEEAVFLAKLSSMPTHPHARCVNSCMLYAGTAWNALTGLDKAALSENFSLHVQGSETEEVLRDRFKSYSTIESWKLKAEKEIRSSGYVVDSLEAALWAFFTTDSFEEGAVLAVNLGDDADTIGAIYGGLAGAYYGFEQIPSRWLDKMKSIDLLNNVVEKILSLRGFD